MSSHYQLVQQRFPNQHIHLTLVELAECHCKHICIQACPATVDLEYTSQIEANWLKKSVATGKLQWCGKGSRQWQHRMSMCRPVCDSYSPSSSLSSRDDSAGGNGYTIVWLEGKSTNVQRNVLMMKVFLNVSRAYDANG